MTINEPKESRRGWVTVVLAALLMLGTLPGRTQGLGLITEPLLKDLGLSHVAYAQINLWATLIGALFCVPAGYLVDRYGLRWVAGVVPLLLGLTVWRMSAVAGAGGVGILFVLITLTRALGQSALSVVSISAVGKSFRKQPGLAMGIYSFLFSILFAIAFLLLGKTITDSGWRVAWREVAGTLVFVIAPLALIFLPGQAGTQLNIPAVAEPDRVKAGFAAGELPESLSLEQALATPAFWIFGGATALFGFVSSGLGLFNEAVLAEHGFGQKIYYEFMAGTTLITLLGQLGCGWLLLRCSLRRLLAVGLFLYALALGMLPLVKTLAVLWVFAGLIGAAGGIIIVIFFTVWGQAFGRAHLGRIQGMAQILTVITSAIAPLCFAQCAAMSGSYTPLLLALSPGVLLLGLAAWNVSLPRLGEPAVSRVAIPAGAQ